MVHLQNPNKVFSVVVDWYVAWQRGFVGAGFMPAFKIKQKILSELERGHKAHAYKATPFPLDLWPGL